MFPQLQVSQISPILALMYLMPDLHCSNGESLDWVPLVFFTCLFHYCSFWWLRCSQSSPMSYCTFMPRGCHAVDPLQEELFGKFCRINTRHEVFCHISSCTWLSLLSLELWDIFCQDLRAKSSFLHIATKVLLLFFLIHRQTVTIKFLSRWRWNPTWSSEQLIWS